MSATITLPALAALLATPARARMLEALQVESPLSATELALVARVQPQTASSHLSRLTKAGVVNCEAQGRHRLYRLANPRVADLLECFAELGLSRTVDNYRPHPDIAQARTCYDHLAGWLGTTLTAAMIDRDQLRARGKDFDLRPRGERFLAELGVDVAASRGQRRLFARRCLDWTENRPHLGGALGAALARHCFQKGWLRQRKDDRRVQVSSAGRRAFAVHFGVTDDE